MKRIVNRLFEGVAHEDRRMLLELLEKDNNASLLDLGCDGGEFTLELAAKIGTSKVSGIEINEEEISKCIRRGVTVIRADLNQPLPFADETFDVVHSSHVIEHLYNTDTFVSEIHRILRRGGYTIIGTPNLAAIYNIACLTLGFQPFATCISDEVKGIGNPFSPVHGKRLKTRDQNHLRIFTYHGLKALLTYHGFSIEKLLGIGYYPLPIKVAKLLVRVAPCHAVNLVAKARKP